MRLKKDIDANELDGVTNDDVLDLYMKLDYSEQSNFIDKFLEYNWIVNLFNTLSKENKEKAYRQITEILKGKK